MAMEAVSLKKKLVVLGNGMAAGRVLEELFARAPDRYDVTIFGAEPRVNYDRIMLSPVLAGEKAFNDIVVHDDAWYAQHNVNLRKGSPIVAIDRAQRVVRTQAGDVQPYDTLIVATGSKPVLIPVPGAELPGVVTFRDLDDVDAMLAAAARGGNAVVIGGGLLGLEAAAGLATNGMKTTVVHLMPTLMERQLDPNAAYLLQRAIEKRGIEILVGANTSAILGDGRVEAVRLDDGRMLPADLVVMAVGIRPNVQLAKDAGLEVKRGLVVDDHLRTNDANIFAVGECVEHRGQCYGLVAPLYDMAKTLAATLADEEVAGYAGSATSTKLKVTGVDLFSAGHCDFFLPVFADPRSPGRLVTTTVEVVAAAPPLEPTTPSAPTDPEAILHDTPITPVIDSGPRDTSGQCLGVVRMFSGTSGRCRKPGVHLEPVAACSVARRDVGVQIRGRSPYGPSYSFLPVDCGGCVPAGAHVDPVGGGVRPVCLEAEVPRPR